MEEEQDDDDADAARERFVCLFALDVDNMYAVVD